jgi:hypothetical protein
MCEVSCRLRGEMEPSSKLDNGSTSHYLSRPHSPASDNSHQRRPLIGPPQGAGPVVMLAAHPLPPGGAQPIPPPTGGLQYETYIKSQLLSNLYLQQYMTNNLANIGHLGVGVGADHLLSFTAAAAAQSAVLPPVPSVTLTAVQSRSKPRRLAAVVAENCGPGPLDLSSSRLEVPAVAATAAAATSAAASQPAVITKISLAPPPAHVRAGENSSVPAAAETGLNLSSALLIKAAAPPAEPAGDVLTKEENEEGEREDDSPPPPPSAREASAASEEPPAAASANPNACPICGQSFTGQDRYAG